MPKRRTKDDDTAPHGVLAATPGLLIRAVMYSPRDFFAGTVAFVTVGAIVGNAIFMQAGRHPSPMFGPPPAFSNATAPAIPNPIPRPRTLETVQAGERALDSRLFDGKPSETRAQAKPESKPEPKPAEPRAEAPAEPKSEKGDPMASLIRHAATPRPQPAPPRAAAPQASAQPQFAANPGAPRPPAPVPTAVRGDPLADLISRGR